eukprot:CAMPEP_0197028950 /NCGR_PEP_ID=MMETSP1384-20130603/8516_1 /TAXON_ID=29189 /ORGANISM="Ammonia sp." /LENGTH=601 /DNA_ID=CAMNT_0042458033 /DNA_START=24 /DNA_END=1829 /DNA_ORIENTATION=+
MSSVLLVYVCFLCLIFWIEWYKFQSKKRDGDFIKESWEQYNVRVHSRVSKYNGPNPFERRETSFYEAMKRLLMTPIALVRVALFVILVMLGAIVSYPASKWRFQRKATSKLLRFCCRIILFIFGFYDIAVTNLNQKGVNINKAARIIVANHHTVFDGIFLLYFTDAVIAATAELQYIPFFGNCMIALNTLFIDRHGKDGRNRAKQQIIDHVNNDNLPPLMIFPQGTTTSIATISTFKPGAFLSGKPVLPVVFDWSHNTNWDVSYVGETGMLKEVFYAGCQFINYCHITILPPICPTTKEGLEPYNFAETVRQEMGKYLQPHCQLTPHSLTDHLLHDFANHRNKFNIDVVGFFMDEIGQKLKLRTKTVQYLAKKFSDLDLNGNGYLEYDEFCAAFKRDPVKHFEKMSKLFQLFQVNNNSNRIGFDEFLNGVSICFVDSMINDAIRVMFDGCSVDNKVIRQSDILNVYNKQIDKERFQDDTEYNKYFDQVQFFVNVVFDYNKIQEMDFNQFHHTIVNKDLGNFVQQFLQIIVMMRLKIKLNKEDFKIPDHDQKQAKQSPDVSGNNNMKRRVSNVVIHQHPRIRRTDSIMSVGATDMGITKNTL